MADAIDAAVKAFVSFFTSEAGEELVKEAVKVVVAAGVDAAQQAIQGKPKVSATASQLQTKVGATTPRAIIMGRAPIAGTILTPTPLKSGKDDRFASNFYALSHAGPSGVVESMIWGDDVVTFDANGNAIGKYNDNMWLFQKNGDWNQTAISYTGHPVLGSSTPTAWDSTKRARGCLTVALVVRYAAKVLGGNMQTPLFVVDANAAVLIDPRTGSAATTQAQRRNPAVWAYSWRLGWFQNSKRVIGMGQASGELHAAGYAYAANVADANGWVISGEATTADDRYAVETAILQACASTPVERNGLQSVVTSAVRSSVGTITSNDLRANPKWRYNTQQSSRPTAIQTRYRSESNRWQMVEGAEVTDASWLTQDAGREKRVMVEYAYAGGGSAHVGHLAALEASNAREPLIFSLPCKQRARYAGFVGDAVTVSLPEIGLSSTKMTVQGRIVNSDGTVDYELLVETDAKYDFAAGKTSAAPSFTLQPGFDIFSVPQPGAAEWASVAAQITSGGITSLPIVRVTGSAADYSFCTGIVFKLRLNSGGSPWVDSVDVPPSVTQHEFRGLTNATSYIVGVAYRGVTGVEGPIRELAAVTTGVLLSGEASSVPWDGVTGGGKPADNATVNRITASSIAPASPLNGDIWVDTTSPVTIYTRITGSWIPSGNIPTSLGQVNSTEGTKLTGIAVGATKNIVTTGLLSARPTGADGDFHFATDTQLLYQKVAGSWVVSANNYTDTNQLTDGAGLGQTAIWSNVSGTGKPADNATVNRITSSTTAPASPVNGDIWVDTNSPVTIKTRVSGSWVSSGNIPTSLDQVNSGEGTKLTGIAIGATKNVLTSGTLASRPAGADGDFHYATDTQELYQKVGGAWVLASTVGARVGVNIYPGSGSTPLPGTQLLNSEIGIDGNGRLTNTGTGSAVVDNGRITIDALGRLTTTGTGSVVVDNSKITLGTLGFTGATDATRNVVSTGLLSARPTGVDGDIFFATDDNNGAGLVYTKIAGAWVADPKAKVLFDNLTTTVNANEATNSSFRSSQTATNSATSTSLSTLSAKFTADQQSDYLSNGQFLRGTNGWIPSGGASVNPLTPEGISGRNGVFVAFSSGGGTQYYETHIPWPTWAGIDLAWVGIVTLWNGGATAGASIRVFLQGKVGAGSWNTIAVTSAITDIDAVVTPKTLRGTSAPSYDTLRLVFELNPPTSGTSTAIILTQRVSNWAGEFPSLDAGPRAVLGTEARVATEETARASADSALATRSTTLESVVRFAAPEALNKNPTFATWSGTLPEDWSDWSFGTSNITKAAGDLSPNAYRQSNPAGVVNYGIYQPLNGRMTQGWHVLEAEVTLNSGALWGGSVHLNWGVSAITHSETIHFAGDADITGSVVAAGTVGRRYRFSKLLNIAVVPNLCNVFLMTSWEGTSTTGNAKDLTWHKCLVRPATQGEIDAKVAKDVTIPATIARITFEEITRSDADDALALRSTNLESTVNHGTTGVAATAARLTVEEGTRADADEALAGRATTLEARSYVKANQVRGSRPNLDSANPNNLFVRFGWQNQGLWNVNYSPYVDGPYLSQDLKAQTGYNWYALNTNAIPVVAGTALSAQVMLGKFGTWNAGTIGIVIYWYSDTTGTTLNSGATNSITQNWEDGLVVPNQSYGGAARLCQVQNQTVPTGAQSCRLGIFTAGATGNGIYTEAGAWKLKLEYGSTCTAWTDEAMPLEIDARVRTEESARASADSALATRSTVLEAVARTRGDSVLPDPDMRDTAWWTAGVSGVNLGDTAGDWRRNRYITFAVNGSFDVFTPYFPVQIGATYRIRVRIWNNAGGWTGAFWPLIHMPNAAWYSLKHGSAVNPDVADAANAIVAGGDTGELEWTVTNVPASGNVNRNWQFRFKGLNLAAGSPAAVSIEIVQLTGWSELQTTVARIATEETVRSDADEALAGRATTLEARSYVKGNLVKGSRPNYDASNPNNLFSRFGWLFQGLWNVANSPYVDGPYLSQGLTSQTNYTWGGLATNAIPVVAGVPVSIQAILGKFGTWNTGTLQLQIYWYSDTAGNTLHSGGPSKNWESGMVIAGQVQGAAARWVDIANAVVPSGVQSFRLGINTINATGNGVYTEGAAWMLKAEYGSTCTAWTDEAMPLEIDARVRTEESARASGDSALATRSTTLEAVVRFPAPEAINKNPTFSTWSGASGTIPEDWTNWSNGATNTKEAGNISPFAYRQAKTAGGTNWGLYQDINGVLTQGWYVLEADIRLNSGTLNGAGAYIQYGVSAITNSVSFGFWSEPDVNGTVHGAGTAGQRYRWAKLVQLVNTANLAQIYVMNSWDGFGDTAGSTRDITWHKCSVRPASDSEIELRAARSGAASLSARITSVDSVAVDGRGRAYAISGTQTEVNGRKGGFVMDNDGVVTNFQITADDFRIYQSVGSGFIVPFRVVGGQTQIDDALIRNLNVIPDGGGPSHRVQLRPNSVSGADGASFTFSTAYGGIPLVRAVITSPPALAAGETYEVVPVSLSTSGFTVRAKKFTPGTPTAQSSGAGSNVGGTPTWQVHKPTSADGDGGQYTFTYTARLTRVSNEFTGSNWYAEYEGSYDVYYNAGSGWVFAYTDTYFSAGFYSSSPSTVDVSASTTASLPAIGQHGGTEFGLHPTLGSITAFAGVSYTTTSQSSVVALPGNFTFDIYPPT